jgi:hypothetical protein
LRLGRNVLFLAFGTLLVVLVDLGKEGVGIVLVVGVEWDAGFTRCWHDRLVGWGRWGIDRGKGTAEMSRDTLKVGTLEDTSITDANCWFGNAVRSQCVVDSVMLQLEQFGNLLEGQEFVHVGSLGFGGHAGSDDMSLPQPLA